jgi:RNA polymerase sigma-70 factor (ECF subfamily)
MRRNTSNAPEANATPPPTSVRRLPIARDDAALVAGLRAGEAWAGALFFDRYAPQVERILRRILGSDEHLGDLVHDAFVQAMVSLPRLREAEALVGWIQAIATHTAYRAIRSRKARRWLQFWAPSTLPEPWIDELDPERGEAYRRTYAVLESLSAHERVAFALRYIDGMDLARLAEACDVSLATIKRRLVRAEQKFAAAARRDEILKTWLEEGGRWAI